MLKYQLNIKNKNFKNIEVIYDSLFLDKDGSMITGVTDPSYGLSERNRINVVSNNRKSCYLEARDVMRCGYIIHNKKYQVNEFDTVIGILYSDGQYYCVEKDYEKIYRGQKTQVLSEIEQKLSNPVITIENREYQLGEWKKNDNDEDFIEWENEIIIPTKYWVYDEQVTIDDITYDVIIDTPSSMYGDKDYHPYIILNNMDLNDNDRILYVMDWEYSKRKKVTLFKIYNEENKILSISNCVCRKKREYFEDLDENGNFYRVYADSFKERDRFFIEMFKKQKSIQIEMAQSNKGTVVDLFIDNLNVDNTLFSAQIWVTPVKNNYVVLHGELKKELNGDDSITESIIFSYYNRTYISKCDEFIEYIVINNEEYEIYTYEKTTNGNELILEKYIMFKNMPLSVDYGNEEKTQAYIKNRFNTQTNENDNTKILFDVKKYNYLIIDEQKYLVKHQQSEWTKENKYFCFIDSLSPFKLQIVDIIGTNILRCQSMNGEDLSKLFSDMQASINDYVCEIKIPIFDRGLVQPMSESVKNYVANGITLYVSHNSLIVPLKMESDNAINLHKDYITHHNFFETQTDGLINRIVDMEKDIYYPSYAEQKGNELVMTLCHQIQIDLHFRSRDLKTWVINDENINNDLIKYPNNWNIFDYYRYSNDKENPHKEFYPNLVLKGDNQYFLPSDLLYFLNFTNEDVFYQKQKIGKSFLRLSFYDTPNPKKQNLLYSSTVFMSETLLYQKYINADKTFSTYLTVKDRSTSQDAVVFNSNNPNDYDIETTYSFNEQNMVNHIGVDTEPCASNKQHTLSFDENKRLSSSFIIKNRNETIDSSDGFYLYLFKEYSSGFHERSIYMRVQFNHAGEGKTINFMQIYNKKENGEKAMLNWASKFNFDKYKDGCSLSELYEHLYIEIKIKYDAKNKRFCYYLPQWMSEKNSDKHTMRLSLFEVKIKDESK